MIMVILNVVNCRLGCVAENVLRGASSTYWRLVAYHCTSYVPIRKGEKAR